MFQPCFNFSMVTSSSTAMSEAFRPNLVSPWAIIVSPLNLNQLGVTTKSTDSLHRVTIYLGSKGSDDGCHLVSQLIRALSVMLVVDICKVCMLKIRTSPAEKSVVFHFDPYWLKSDGSIVSQPVPLSLML